MFLVQAVSVRAVVGFPRIRGDVPGSPSPPWAMKLVFPAYAGMFLEFKIIAHYQSGFPRIRGDVPFTQ